MSSTSLMAKKKKRPFKDAKKGTLFGGFEPTRDFNFGGMFVVSTFISSLSDDTPEKGNTLVPVGKVIQSIVITCQK